MIYDLDVIDLENACKELDIFQDGYNYKIVPVIRTYYSVEGEEVTIEGLGQGKEILSEHTSYILKSHGQLYKISVICDCEKEEVRYSATKIDKIGLEDIKGIQNIKNPDKDVSVTLNDVMDMFNNGWDWAGNHMKSIDEDLIPFLMSMRSYLSKEIEDIVVEETIKKLDGDSTIKSEELKQRIDYLDSITNEDNEQQILLMLQMVVDKFSPKDVLQHSMHTANRDKTSLLTTIDALITYTLDEKESKNLLSFMDAMLENYKMSKQAEENDILTDVHKKAGGIGNIVQVKRGEVYWAKITRGVGHEDSGIRPVLIITNDGTNIYGTKVTCLMMGSVKRDNKGHLISTLPPEYRIFDKELTFGKFKKPTAVDTGAIYTIDKARLEEHYVTISDKKMRFIELKVFNQLGISADCCKEYLEYMGYEVKEKSE